MNHDVLQINGIRLLTSVAEAAAVLAISPAKTYELVARGHLRAVRIGKAVRIPFVELQRFVDTGLVPPHVPSRISTASNRAEPRTNREDVA